MEKKEIAKIIRDARVSAGIKAKDLEIGRAHV